MSLFRPRVRFLVYSLSFRKKYFTVYLFIQVICNNKQINYLSTPKICCKKRKKYLYNPIRVVCVYYTFRRNRLKANLPVSYLIRFWLAQKQIKYTIERLE